MSPQILPIITIKMYLSSGDPKFAPTQIFGNMTSPEGLKTNAPKQVTSRRLGSFFGNLAIMAVLAVDPRLCVAIFR